MNRDLGGIEQRSRIPVLGGGRLIAICVLRRGLPRKRGRVGKWTIMGTAEEREAFWRSHHEAWRRSNLNQREYCEVHGLVLERFETSEVPG
jgi:hypothetical protein